MCIDLFLICLILNLIIFLTSKKVSELEMTTMLDLTEIGCGSRVIINDSCNTNRDELLLDIISANTSSKPVKSITVIAGKDRLAFYNQRVPEAQCHTEFKKITLTGLYAGQCSAITQAKQAGIGTDSWSIEPVMLILDSGTMLDEFLATKVSKDIMANAKRLGFILIMLDERHAKHDLSGFAILGAWPITLTDYIFYPVHNKSTGQTLDSETNKYNVLTNMRTPVKSLKYYMIGHDFEMTELDSSITATRPKQTTPAIIISESEIEPFTDQQVNNETDAEQKIEDNKKEETAINTSNATPAVVTQQATSSGGLLSGLWWLLGY